MITKITWQPRSREEMSRATNQRSYRRQLAVQNAISWRPGAPSQPFAASPDRAIQSNTSSTVSTSNPRRIIGYIKRVTQNAVQCLRTPWTGSKRSCRTTRKRTKTTCTCTECESSTTRTSLRGKRNWSYSGRNNLKSICWSKWRST